LSAGKCGRDIVGLTDVKPINDIEAELARRGNRLVPIQNGAGSAGVGDDREPAEVRNHLTQEFEPLAGRLGLLERQTGHGAAWPRQ
jgi:hypothetical protein